ncbi:MAG: hypothetical protein ING84_08560 [Cytophagales bacterium]|jgi:hypothetical protein|nr:hypothetical protein [Cytophagales bacterium]MCA6366114.1 hypothetical protein [Cytophagales bacterium]MCA6373069.1 hypothetical protein [Cytophagales bacterium]MCA6375921.1 hypothetical protein [Cytophagales bacterium]MCA6383534.1 hypothetical protein [Cytophagales bacterium]
MNKKSSVHFFTFILAAWLLAFTVVSVGFCEGKFACEEAPIITKLHVSSLFNLMSEPCEEKEARDSFGGLPVVFTSYFFDAASGTVDSMLSPCLQLHSVSSFGSTTNLPIYLAKKSFLI